MCYEKMIPLLAGICLISACASGSATPAGGLPAEASGKPDAAAHSADANTQDLFPDKVTLHYARAFTVEYHRSYKVVTVVNPWRGAQQSFQYILVQRGAAVPAADEKAQIIEIPVSRLASLSATHMPYLDELGVLDTLAAVGEGKFINTPGVVEGLRSGKIREVGKGPETNIESLLELQPEMVTILALGNPQKDNYQQLQQKGLKPVIVSDYMEETPLGRAEWIKFMALFFNREAQAETIFRQIEDRYVKMKTLAAAVNDRPTVVMGFEINGVWNMPGGRSYQTAYIGDAGGNYLWADDDSTGRIPLSFETVFEKASQADFWFNQSVNWLSAADVLAADPRYQKFEAFTGHKAYNNNARLNETGGNDYDESGHANPDVILADLISILHPDLLPGHRLVYYRPLK